MKALLMMYQEGFLGARFEGGEGSNKPIITKDDFTKKPWDTFHFQVLSQLISSGVTGEHAKVMRINCQ